MSTPPTLTLDQAAARWQISTRTLRRLIQAGDIAAIRIGRQIRIPTETVRRVESPSQARKV